MSKLMNEEAPLQPTTHHPRDVAKNDLECGWVPRRCFPPICPGTGRECIKEKCSAAREYSWRRVFLSIPFDAPYLSTRQLLMETLKTHKLIGVTAPDYDHGTTVAENIAGCICSCAHSIVELSRPSGDATAPGVLAESGFVRTMMSIDNILFIGKKKTRTPPELDGYLRHSYANMTDLKKNVDKWARKYIVRPMEAVKRILFSSGECEQYATWLHCTYPEHTGRTDLSDAPPGKALSGGGSGSELIHIAFNRLRSIDDYKGSYRLREPPSNTEKKYPNKAFEKAIRKEASIGNLYLLDAPVAKGASWKYGLNWVTKGVLHKLFRQSQQKPTACFHLLPKAGKEEKKIVYGYKNRKYQKADNKKDYGIIIRAPNPYCHGAFVLIMAGIHAPGSHAAAEIVVTPTLAKNMLDRIYQDGNWPNDLYFEVVFSVKRTYYADGLGKPEWIHHERLD